MNKNINTGVELTEKELAYVCGGCTKRGYIKARLKEVEKELIDRGWPTTRVRDWLKNY